MLFGKNLSPLRTCGVKEPFPKGKGATVLFVVISRSGQIQAAARNHYLRALCEPSKFSSFTHIFSEWKVPTICSRKGIGAMLANRSV